MQIEGTMFRFIDMLMKIVGWITIYAAFRYVYEKTNVLEVLFASQIIALLITMAVASQLGWMIPYNDPKTPRWKRSISFVLGFSLWIAMAWYGFDYVSRVVEALVAAQRQS